MTKIKICGLSREQDIIAANSLGIDYVGFVFAKSRRQVSLSRASQLKQLLSSGIKAVGVFVGEDIDVVCRAVQSNIIDIAQLHGSEDEEYIAELKRRGVCVIKAISVSTAGDILAWRHSSADMLLLDNGSGGSGQKFDHSVLCGIGLEKPYFVAGGLNAESVTSALEYSPYALDVSSGVEIDGFKDENEMRKFVEAVRINEKR